MLKAVQAFNPYDLYSKSDAPPKVSELKVGRQHTFTRSDMEFVLISLPLGVLHGAHQPILPEPCDQMVI